MATATVIGPASSAGGKATLRRPHTAGAVASNRTLPPFPDLPPAPRAGQVNIVISGTTARATAARCGARRVSAPLRSSDRGRQRFDRRLASGVGAPRRPRAPDLQEDRERVGDADRLRRRRDRGAIAGLLADPARPLSEAVGACAVAQLSWMQMADGHERLHIQPARGRSSAAVRPGARR